ncbi:MAG: GxxExxY protein [Planctomycetaceae bacterium]|nr:GxxExxY protein [Planctomycetaceae bacterium]
MNHNSPDADPRDPETYAIIGAAMEVHRELGPGFLEAVYQDALEIEFRLREIPNDREIKLPLFYKGELLETFYRADFRCFGRIMIELKAASQLTGVDEGQLLNYLKTTRLRRGLLLNFGRSSLEVRRLVFDPPPVIDTTIINVNSPSLESQSSSL